MDIGCEQDSSHQIYHQIYYQIYHQIYHQIYTHRGGAHVKSPVRGHVRQKDRRVYLLHMEDIMVTTISHDVLT